MARGNDEVRKLSKNLLGQKGRKRHRGREWRREIRGRKNERRNGRMYERFLPLPFLRRLK